MDGDTRMSTEPMAETDEMRCIVCAMPTSDGVRAGEIISRLREELAEAKERIQKQRDELFGYEEMRKDLESQLKECRQKAFEEAAQFCEDNENDPIGKFIPSASIRLVFCNQNNRLDRT